MSLTILVKGKETFNELTEEFDVTKDQVLLLEHSLVSISKWEAKFHKPFLTEEQKTADEILYYIKCMTLTQNVPNIVYQSLSEKNIEDITKYIEDKHTATWFREETNQTGSKPIRKRVVTSELIYCWMVQLQIPWEAQKWHLNRLLILIRVINEENKPADKKKQNNASRLRDMHKLNEERLKQFGGAG